MQMCIRDRFRHIDQVAEFNQAKVIAAMQKNRVNATHFNLSTGYGYDDEGRDLSLIHIWGWVPRNQFTAVVLP